ncbi:SPFH domain-containing protein [Thalassiella azotivora]
MSRVTVPQGFAAVVVTDGRVSDVLPAGRHRLPSWGAWRRRVTRVDVREQVLVVSGQEVAAADVPGVKVTAAASWRVADPAAWLTVAAQPAEQLRLAVQLAVRDWAASGDLAELVSGRAAAAERLTAAVTAEVQRLGVGVAQVSVRDLVVPAEVRRAVLAVQTAKQEGLARLERARAETAAVRALANGARVLQDNPALLQLRTVQAAGESAGTVVLSLGAAGTGGGGGAAGPSAGSPA